MTANNKTSKKPNVVLYAAMLENWVKNNLDYKLDYTFVVDFAVAEFFGIEAIKETYSRCKQEWLDNYKAFTEVAIAVNMLSWAHYYMKREKREGQDGFIKVYTELWHKASLDFLEKYKGNEKATGFFFDRTD